MNRFAPIVPDWPDLPANMGALATTRSGGASAPPYDDGAGGGGFNLGLHVGDHPVRVQHNRQQLEAAIGARPAWISQVHGIEVVDAARVLEASVAPEADASITRHGGQACVVMTADCLPVLFADLDGKVVGAAHAGWRGLAAGVLGETVAAMRSAGAGEITAWLGPAIGAGEFEVGTDVLDAFMAAARDSAEGGRLRAAFAAYPGRSGKYLADMNALACCLLARDGVSRIAGGAHCTVREHAQFYSYRRDGVTGRQASLIWLK